MSNMKILSALVVAGSLFTSCSEKNLFHPEYSEKQYAENFIKKYGAVSPEQTWDFASSPTYFLKQEETKATRADGEASVVVGEYYYVQSETLSWLKNKLKEGKDNRSLGKPFAMTAPNNSFTIVPIYQGQAGMTWDLHMVVGTGENAQDIKIWSKSEGIQTSTYGISWSDLKTSGTTMNSNYVRSHQYTINNVPVGETIYFYLEITKGSDNYATKGTKQSSLSGMMLALDCPRPSNIDEKNEVMIIGCEDANLKGSDWDLNDVVFLVYGNPDVPKPLDIEDMTIVQKYEKRYMIEDLGTTDDFDFNDIVVDVTAQRQVTYTLVNGVIDYSKTKYGEWAQMASIKHLGGTLAFRLKIGDTLLDEMQGEMMGYNDELTDRNYTISGWNPEENNISVTVRNKQSEAVYPIGFPKKGDVPMIIAFSNKTHWMPERQSIPEDWFTEE